MASTKIAFSAIWFLSLTDLACTSGDARSVESPRDVDTNVACELIGLGAYDTVPFNFPGADSASLDEIREDSPLVLEASLPPGGNPHTGRVFAGDMGWPFEHEDSVYFIFDDALFPPGSARSSCVAGDPSCKPTTLHDDVLAKADPNSWGAQPKCLSLQIDRAPGSPEFLPITVDGERGVGGRLTGPGTVVGPGFSSGPFMFMLAPQAVTYCSTDEDCSAEADVDGDVCRRASLGEPELCYFGPCEPGQPCALRLHSSSLVVRTAGSAFVTPSVGEHIQSSAALRAYRGHFATVSFQPRIDPATGDGVVWVLGRDSFWGTPGLTMSPYLMFHPVSDGVLGDPQFFTGLVAGEPRYSANQRDAVPLYQEDKALPHHSSWTFVSEGRDGIWLLIYGGHAQPSLRGYLGTFVQPVVDTMFYDRAAGIYLRWSAQPWGPWSDPVTIWNPYLPGQGGYCEYMYFNDPEGKSGYACPTELAEHNAELNRWPTNGMAGAYGASFVPRLARVAEDRLSFQWLLSTWNPYRVVMLRTELSVKR